MVNQKLTLDRKVTYQIQVPGIFDPVWYDSDITVGYDEKGLPLSTLTGKFDQARLHGLLRRLYGFGLPIISVNIVDE